MLSFAQKVVTLQTKCNCETMITKILKLLRTWKLLVAMVMGVILYYVFEGVIPDEDTEQNLYYGISHWLQPTLIFSMLFLSFLKVETKELRPHKWHGVLLLTQGGMFVVCSLAALMIKQMGWGDNSLLLAEGAMLCFICPTATASAVIVQKLGGSLSGDVTYIVLCNLMVSLLAPGFLSLIEPHAGLDFITEFFMIMGKVFPLLLCPLFVALIVRHYFPRMMEKMLSIHDLAFYMWLVALALAITVTVRTIVESNIDIVILFGLAVVSCLCCIFQFAVGRMIGLRNNDPITAAQAFGQKNTVFAIWMGLVFLNPVTSVVGGFYSIWHNVINSWQLGKRERMKE